MANGDESLGAGMDRRRFLGAAGLALLSAGAGSACMPAPTRRRAPREAGEDREWRQVRALFDLDPELIHMSALLLSSHPRPVREAIERHRRELDRDPVGHLQAENDPRQTRVLRAASDYLGASPGDIALTDSTTMGLGLVYTGLELRPGDEVLATEHDYYSTHESLRLAAERTGAAVRRIPLYESLATVSAEEIVQRLTGSLVAATRAVALTWVHSGTGLKLPVAEISQALAEVNRDRPAGREVLLCVDGVHGFGVEDFSVGALGCDFFIAGAHKWLFGPRGTGIVWGSDRGWQAVRPTIPSFMEDASWSAWVRGTAPSGPTNGRRFSPGGFKPFEHQWALATTFDVHQEIGKRRIEGRTHQLASRLKEGLTAMDHVELHTPRAPELSSGIVCFDVRGMRPRAVVARLRTQGIVATVTPYATRHARLTPGICNGEGEVDAVLEAIAGLG